MLVDRPVSRRALFEWDNRCDDAFDLQPAADQPIDAGLHETLEVPAGRIPEGLTFRPDRNKLQAINVELVAQVKTCGLAPIERNYADRPAEPRTPNRLLERGNAAGGLDRDIYAQVTDLRRAI